MDLGLVSFMETKVGEKSVFFIVGSVEFNLDPIYKS